MSYTLYTNIKAKSISYGGSRKASNIKYIVIHYTSNKTDKAVNNAKYYRDTNKRSAGAHYFVDDTSVYQSIDDLKSAYAVGGSKYSSCKTSGGGKMYGKITNSNSISIEMCSTNGKITDATIANAVALTKTLMTKYNISASNVYRHFDVNGKCCPSSLYTGSWAKTDTWIGTNPTQWNKFKSLLGATTTTSYVINGVDYSPVFDPTYYSNKYSDLKSAFGTNATLLFNHFINNGMKEMRQASAKFNVQAYATRYADLRNAFGALTANNAVLYYNHYCTNGLKEGRNGV